MKPAKKIKHSLGQHVFFEFRLCEITGMNADRVVELSDAYVRCMSSDFSDQIFPVTMQGKRLSDMFTSQRDRLRNAVPSHVNLNWPEISHAYAERWCLAMRRLDDDNAIRDEFAEVEKFTSEFIEAAQAVRAVEVRGIPILRR